MNKEEEEEKMDWFLSDLELKSCVFMSLGFLGQQE